MMTNEEAAVWTALIVAVPTVLTAVVVPIVLRIIDNRNKAAELEAQHRREDIVAVRAQAGLNMAAAGIRAAADRGEEAARLVKVNTEITEARADQANESRDDGFRKTNEKLDVIHKLVNSNMTAALKAELDATRREFALMNEIIELKKATGLQPTTAVLVELESAEVRLEELAAHVKERLDAQSS